MPSTHRKRTRGVRLLVLLPLLAPLTLVAACGGRSSLDDYLPEPLGVDLPEPDATAAFDGTIVDASTEPSTNDVDDAGVDARLDDGHADGVRDAARDVEQDAALDGGDDAQPDAAPDAADDAAPDAPSDAGRDASCTVTYGPPIAYPIGPWARTLALGDVTGDGKVDIVFNDQRMFIGDSISVLRGLGARTFAAEVSYPARPTEIVGLAVVDMNGDGNLDVVATELQSSTVGVYINAGGGVLGPRVDYAAGGGADGGTIYAANMAAGDLNGDGQPDIVVGEQDLVGPSGGVVGVLINGGAGGLLPQRTYPNSAAAGSPGGTYWRGPTKVAIADLNADGANDVVIVTVDEHVAIYLNQGDGTLAPEVQYSIGAMGPSGDVNTQIAIADLDGDGMPDLAVTNGWGAAVGVLLNIGGGAFGAEVPVVAGQALGFENQYLVVADIDHDGKSDIITSSFYGDQPGVSVFLNQGGATFASPKTYAADAADFIEGLAVADVDGDGVTDIVVVADSTHQVEVFYGSCL